MAYGKKRPAARGNMKGDKAKRERKDDPRVCQTPPGVVGFCHVWEKHKYEDAEDGDEGQFSLTLVMKGDADLSAVKKACKIAAFEFFTEERATELMRKGKLLVPYKRPADEFTDYGPPFDSADEGAIVLKAHSNQQPGVVDNHRNDLVDETDFYRGCIARMSVFCHAYEYRGKTGVTLLLNNVQRIGKGEKIQGSRKNASEEFDEIDSDDDDDMGDDDLFN